MSEKPAAGHIATFNPSKREIPTDLDASHPVVFLPMEKVSENGEIDCSEVLRMKEVFQGFTYFKRNDVVLAKITPCFENGKGAYLDNLATEFGFGTTEFIVFRSKGRVHPQLLRWFTWLRVFRDLGKLQMTGSAGQQRIPTEFVKEFVIAFPPTVDEQEQLIRSVKERMARIDAAIAKPQKEIEAIQEYAARLISDVVTGKVDVRSITIPDIYLDEPHVEIDLDVDLLDETVDEEEAA